MQNRKARTATYGPWLVGLGAALWEAESAWRIPLNELFDAEVIVFWGTRFILIMFLPILISRAARNPESARTHMGLFDFLGVCGFRRGHGLFHAGVEVRQPDGGKRGSEYSARYLNAWRVFPFR